MKKTKAVVSTALATGLASTAGAATVQISIFDNGITSFGNSLNADITGDLNADLSLSAAAFSPASVGVYISGNRVSAQFNGSDYVKDAQFNLGGVGVPSASGSAGSITYLNPITFTDSRINSGASTQGWLQVFALNLSTTNHVVAFQRLIFDDASTTRPAYASIPGSETEWTAVPEPSSFALLTLGAGGLLLRRRRKAA